MWQFEYHPRETMGNGLAASAMEISGMVVNTGYPFQQKFPPNFWGLRETFFITGGAQKGEAIDASTKVDAVEEGEK